jgi:effector-binding domain-containing protein
MSTLALEFTVTHVPEQTFAFVVRTVGPGEAGEFIRGAIARVHAFAEAHGGAQGPPLAIPSAPDEDGALALEVGWPVAAGTAAEPPVEVRRLAPTVALVHLHVGPYEELPALYRELSEQAHDRGFTLAAPPRERYLTAPGDGPPVTEIVWPIA